MTPESLRSAATKHTDLIICRSCWHHTTCTSVSIINRIIYRWVFMNWSQESFREDVSRCTNVSPGDWLEKQKQQPLINHMTPAVLQNILETHANRHYKMANKDTSYKILFSSPGTCCVLATTHQHLKSEAGQVKHARGESSIY